MRNLLELANGTAVAVDKLPRLEVAMFADAIKSAVAEGRYVAAFFPLDVDDGVRLLTVLGDERGDDGFRCGLGPVIGTDRKYPSLTPAIPQLHWFEREVAEVDGIIPEGHPWLKPIRAGSGAVDWFTLGGDEAHEVAVGPVHAGVIEPGHFRFQCVGENVHHLEIELGYQRRGVERMLVGGPDAKSEFLIETAAGDTSVAASLCYARNLKALGMTSETAADDSTWTALLELERIANHVGDLGALAGDVAYLPTASYCGRIRGEYLNMTAEICGNRFGRGATRCRLTAETANKIEAWIARVKPELDNALDLMFDQPSVLDRFEGTGTVSREDADAIGMVGVAGRASREFDGDVMSRARIRRMEIEESHRQIMEALKEARCAAKQWGSDPQVASSKIAISSAAAWRGPLVQVAVTDAAGRFARYKIVDPSFHNWFGLALALRGGQISNFPICNKSFNLSYCGHDL